MLVRVGSEETPYLVTKPINATLLVAGVAVVVAALALLGACLVVVARAPVPQRPEPRMRLAEPPVVEVAACLASRRRLVAVGRHSANQPQQGPRLEARVPLVAVAALLALCLAEAPVEAVRQLLAVVPPRLVAADPPLVVVVVDLRLVAEGEDLPLAVAGVAVAEVRLVDLAVVPQVATARRATDNGKGLPTRLDARVARRPRPLAMALARRPFCRHLPLLQPRQAVLLRRARPALLLLLLLRQTRQLTL